MKALTTADTGASNLRLMGAKYPSIGESAYFPFSPDLINRTKVFEPRRIIVGNELVDGLVHRLKLLNETEFDQNEYLDERALSNVGYALRELKQYLIFLDPSEVGPSEYGTVLLTLQSISDKVVLEIGNTSVGMVYRDKNGSIASKSSDWDDPNFWDQLRLKLDAL